jgi:hypothetical protein
MLHFETVGVKPPIRRVMEALISQLSSCYRPLRAFRAANVNHSLPTLERDARPN